MAGVVGVAGEDGHGAIELLGEDEPGEGVRKRHGAEGKEEVGAGESGGRPSAGGADGEGDGALAGVAQDAEAVRKVEGRHELAGAVAKDEEGLWLAGTSVVCFEQGGF